MSAGPKISVSIRSEAFAISWTFREAACVSITISRPIGRSSPVSASTRDEQRVDELHVGARSTFGTITQSSMRARALDDADDRSRGTRPSRRR